MPCQVARFLRSENGEVAIEYALIAMMITVGTIAALTSIGQVLVGSFTKVQAGLTPAK